MGNILKFHTFGWGTVNYFSNYSDFAPSDWPILKDFWGANFKRLVLFLVRVMEKKPVLEPKIPHKTIGGINVDLVYLNITKKV